VALLLFGSWLVAGKVGTNGPSGSPGLPPLGPPSAFRDPPWKKAGPVSPGKIRTSLSLEQDPAGETSIKVDVMLEDLPPSK
jgi:hypothetical protein